MKIGKFEEAYLGVFAYDKQAIQYINSDIELETGIYVVQIAKDGPCSNTGLKEGDIISQIDNFEINTMSELKQYIYEKKPGEQVRLKILRNNNEYILNVNLGRKP